MMKHMEHMSQTGAQKFENGAAVSWEYDMQGAHLNVAPISISGRYPHSGFTRNLESDAIIHIISGAGILGLSDGSSVLLAKNDQIHLSIGDSYYFEGNLDIIYAASPPWTAEQSEHSN